MKELKYILLALMMLPLTLAVSSCSEENEDEDEFVNWQVRNDEIQSQWANNSSLKKIKAYTMDPNTAGGISDYVYVESLDGTAISIEDDLFMPIFTDTCRVAYRGYLIPSKSYPNGYIFDQSYLGDFKWTTAAPYTAVCSSFVVGFTTALMKMHVGERWRVYIPYQLAYGGNSSTSYPAYSNMIFDIALFEKWKARDIVPPFKTR